MGIGRSFSEPIPRKGTETARPVKIEEKKNQVRFSEPIPRKGTETFWEKYLHEPFIITSFSEPIPRKGTETTTLYLEIRLLKKVA